MPNAQARISAAVLASGALHLLLVTLGREPVRLGQGLQSPSHQVENEMNFEVLTAPPAAPPERVPTPSAASVFKPRSHTGRARSVAAPPPVNESTQDEAIPAEHAPAGVPRGSSLGASAPAAHGPDLSPGAAARTLTSETSAGWSVAQRDTAYQQVDRSAEALLAHAIPELSRSGDDKADHRAEELTWLAARPWEYILKPLRGARYHFRGMGFDAIIQADGSVQYRDKSGLRVMGGQTSTQETRAGPIPPPTPTFGLGFNDAASGKLFGYDAHKSERRRFLERTHALRELLHERSRRVALARADAHLSRSLNLIELELEAGDAHSARTQLFALWDACAEDEVGAVARRRIETFAREQCREGSALTFAPAELAAFNQSRTSRQRFDPYRALADAGVSEVRVAADD